MRRRFMLTLSKKSLLKAFKMASPLLITSLLLSFPAFAHSMGMDFDFGDGTTTEESTCTPDTPLVIIPGPIGSPVRVVAVDAQTRLAVDYSKKTIYKIDQDATPTPFFKTEGKPLSVAVHYIFFEKGKRAGELRRVEYFVGNDDNHSIDVYSGNYSGKAEALELVDRFFLGDQGVQALDMAFSQELGQLFVVDGLAREIKVLWPNGELVGSFGGEGVLSAPKGIAVDAATQEVFVSDYGDSRVGIPASIKVFNLANGAVRSITGNFDRPQGLALSSDKLFVSDNMLAQILEFDRISGVMTLTYGCLGSSAGHLMLPMDVALDSALNNLYIADNRNMRITVLPLTSAP